MNTNKLTRIPIRTSVDKSTLIDALQTLYEDDDFNHQQWSFFEAEFFEKLAKRIREGYEETHPKLTLKKP